MADLTNRLYRLEGLRSGPCPGHETAIVVEHAGRDNPPEPPRSRTGCGRATAVLTITFKTVPDRSGP